MQGSSLASILDQPGPEVLPFISGEYRFTMTEGRASRTGFLLIGVAGPFIQGCKEGKTIEIVEAFSRLPALFGGGKKLRTFASNSASQKGQLAST